MPYGSVASAGLPITGFGGLIGAGWVVVLGMTVTLLGFGALGLVNLRRSQLSAATAQIRNVAKADAGE